MGTQSDPTRWYPASQLAHDNAPVVAQDEPVTGDPLLHVHDVWARATPTAQKNQHTHASHAQRPRPTRGTTCRAIRPLLSLCISEQGSRREGGGSVKGGPFLFLIPLPINRAPVYSDPFHLSLLSHTSCIVHGDLPGYFTVLLYRVLLYSTPILMLLGARVQCWPCAVLCCCVRFTGTVRCRRLTTLRVVLVLVRWCYPTRS